MVDYLQGAGGSNQRPRFGARPAWTAAAKARIVATVLKGGVPAAQVARSHGLAASQVYNWIAATRAGRLATAAKGAGVAKPSGTAMSFARVVTPVALAHSPSPHTTSSGIVIELGRAVIRVHPGADLQLLREVLRMAHEFAR